MASGQSVVQVLDVQIPAANGAALTARAGGSTPAERLIIYALDAAAIEYIDFKCLLLPNYGGGGLTTVSYTHLDVYKRQAMSNPTSSHSPGALLFSWNVQKRIPGQPKPLTTWTCT